MVYNPKYNIGDNVIISTDISPLVGSFEIGTIVVVVTDVNEFGYSIRDKYGNKLNDIGWII